MGDFLEGLASLAWPALVGGVFWYFRAEIKEMIPRIRRVGPTGAELDAPQKAESLSQERDDVKGQLPAAASAPLPPPTPTNEYFEKPIWADVKQAREVHNFSTEEILAAVVRLLAVSRTDLAFERIYWIMFNSQLRLVRLLHERDEVLRSQALELFEKAKADYPDMHQSRTFEEWLGFGVSVDLAKIDGDKILRTFATSDFVMYITSRRLPEVKAG